MPATTTRIEMSFKARRGCTIAVLSTLAVAPLFALRLHEAEPGLLYPDGYQYLLMAKGIAAHGRPLLTLGPHGDTLLPSADAATKPLYPAVVALFHALGLTWFTAARALSALAAACTVVLTGLLGRRLAGSWLAAAVAASACLASRELSFWSGFSGPDALGQALALGSALAFLDRRPRLGGLLAALAILARPELALVALAAACVGLARKELRPPTRRAASAGALSLLALLGVLRPPLEEPPFATVVLAVLLAALAGAAFLILTREGPRITASMIVGVLAAIAFIAPLSTGAEGIRQWARNDWTLLLAGLIGFSLAVRAPRLRPALHVTLLAGALLVSVYGLKNPSSDRYMSLLTPLVALLASFATTTTRSPLHRRVVVLGVVGLIAITLAVPRLPPHAPDGFPTVAGQLEALQLPRLPFVTAAPDAYGVLLPRQSFVVARPGARGLIIADGAQRAYSPSLHLEGRTLATLDPGAGFVRPDGAIDRQPVRILLGTIAGQASSTRFRERASPGRGDTRHTSASHG
jgi:hypothetical protein